MSVSPPLSCGSGGGGVVFGLSERLRSINPIHAQRHTLHGQPLVGIVRTTCANTSGCVCSEARPVVH